MKKFNFVFVGIILISIYFGYKLINRGLHITLVNNTENDIEEIYFTYEGISEYIEVDKLKANSKLNIRINPKGEFNENVLSMYYLDTLGNRKFTEVTYFEKGYNTDVKITFNKLTNSSNFDIDIDLKLGY